MCGGKPPALVCHYLVFLVSSERHIFFFNIRNWCPCTVSLSVTLGGLLKHLTFVFSLFRVPGIFLLKTYCVILTSRYLATFSLSHQQESSFCPLQASPCCFHSNFLDLTLLVLPHDFRPPGLRREPNTSSSTKIQMSSWLR